MKTEMYTDEDIEFALQLLCYPERMGMEEAVEWLRDSEHVKLLRELRYFREVGFRGTGTVCPDVNGEWRMFQARHRVARKRFHWGWASGVAAAVVLLLFSFVWMFLYPGNDGGNNRGLPLAGGKGEGVTIITSEGERVLVTPGLVELGEDAKSENVFTDSIRGVSYARVKGDSVRRKEYHTLRVPAKGDFFIQFADGTKVWLNSDTELRYPLAFDDDVREVELLKGEAYFEVSRDEMRPFRVITEEIVTRVLGTEFNVRTNAGKGTNVTLVTGSVGVSGNKQEMAEVVLEPGECASLESGGLVVEKVDVQKYVAWKDGYFYYNDVRLEDMLDELGKWFDFTVFYWEQAVKDYRVKFWVGRQECPREVVKRLNDLGTLHAEWKEGCIMVRTK